MAKNSQARPKPAKYKKYMLVRYGRMNTLGLFEHRESRIHKVHARVVVKTSRGLELGYLVGRLSSYKGGQFRLSPEQMKEYFNGDDTDSALGQAGKFIRYATSADVSEERHLRKIAREEIECCRNFIKEMDLPMKIVDAEHVFGGERIIFYFMSDGRVDFQSCGQQCCCQRFLKLLKPVNMRMAKMQKATLDPAKISGYCGRLKCCLRYEDKTYTELKKRLPKKNTKVKTKQGQGKVVDTQILTQLVMVEYESGERSAVCVDELEIISPSTTKEKGQNSTSQDNMQNDQESTKP